MTRLPIFAAALVALFWWLFHITKRKSLRITLVVVAVVLALPLSLLVAQWSYEAYMMVRAGQIRSQLESYRGAHGEYPIALSQLDISEAREGIYYQRDYGTSLVYYLWFGTGVGTVSQYDSKTRTWQTEG
jgi:uncharacterized membrane protein